MWQARKIASRLRAVLGEEVAAAERQLRARVDALVRFSPAGWLTMKPLSGGRVVVVSAAEVLDVSNIERIQAGEEPLR